MIEIEVQNVRCIRSCKIRLNKGRPTVIVGTNNSGKSSLLEVIAKSLWSIPGNRHFRNSEVDRIALSTSFYRREATSIKRPESYLTLSLTELNESGLPEGKLGYRYLASLREDFIEPDQPNKIFLAPCEIVLDIGGNRRSLLALNDPAKISVLTNIEEMQLNLAKGLIEARPWTYMLTDSQAADMTVYTTSNFRNLNTPVLRTFQNVVDRVFYIPAARNPDFSPHQHDSPVQQNQIDILTPVMKRISHDHKAWNILQSSVSLLFNEVSELKLLPLGGQLAPYVKLAFGDMIPVSDMGFGLKNAIQILATMCAAPSNSVLLIDEPEQGLNQSRQQDLANLIEMLRPDLTLCVTTQAEAFCKGLDISQLYLAEVKDGTSEIIPLNIREDHKHRRLLAKIMGVNPLYLMEGGKIVYVEGQSDQQIIREWLSLNFGDSVHKLIDIQDLGGAGKIAQEFAKPMFLNFQDKIFIILDSDGDSEEKPIGDNIARLVAWFKEKGIINFYVLRKREIENYIGHEAIAQITGIHSSKIEPPQGKAPWFDLKAAVIRELGFYDEKKISVAAYMSLGDKRTKLFGDENQEIVEKLKPFLST